MDHGLSAIRDEAGWSIVRPRRTAVTRRETIEVPAGSFDTFAVEGLAGTPTSARQLDVRLWLVPGLNWHVKMEQVRRKMNSRFVRTERFELVSLYQQNFG